MKQECRGRRWRWVTYEETGGTVKSLSSVIRLTVRVAFFLGQPPLLSLTRFSTGAASKGKTLSSVDLRSRRRFAAEADAAR